MVSIKQIRDAINRYVLRIPIPQPKEYILPLVEVQDRGRAWSHSWSANPGICIFCTADGVHYIGRALASVGLAGRVHAQSQPWTQEWNAVLTDPTFSVAVYEFREQNEEWIPSIEFSLIKQFSFQFNQSLLSQHLCLLDAAPPG